MRVLAATSEIDPRDGGFSFTVPGELLGPSVVCPKPGCGCEWSFSGLASDHGTTLAVVEDRADLDESAYEALEGDSWFAEVAAAHEVGTLFVCWHPRIVELSEWIDRHGLSVRPEADE